MSAAKLQPFCLSLNVAISFENRVSPIRSQAIIYTNAGHTWPGGGGGGGGGGFKNAYELLNPRALKISMLHKYNLFQLSSVCVCVCWQRYDMETLSTLLALCEGNLLVTVRTFDVLCC